MGAELRGSRGVAHDARLDDGAARTRCDKSVRLYARALAAAEPPSDFGELFNLVTGESDRLPVPVSRVEGLSWLDDVAARLTALVDAERAAPFAPQELTA